MARISSPVEFYDEFLGRTVASTNTHYTLRVVSTTFRFQEHPCPASVPFRFELKVDRREQELLNWLREQSTTGPFSAVDFVNALSDEFPEVIRDLRLARFLLYIQ